MTNTPLPPNDAGRGSAMIVYVLYLLSIPSFALFALVGVIVALAGRDGAGPLARSHLDDQVRVWFVAFWWAIGLAVIALVGWITVFIGIGILILWLVAIVGFIVMVWFTVKSFLGLLALLDGRPR
ncbi:hypothetical protein [Terricaulis silvestris]|nr:hypothetical protein [Terricaulis silvestris]